MQPTAKSSPSGAASSHLLRGSSTSVTGDVPTAAAAVRSAMRPQIRVRARPTVISADLHDAEAEGPLAVLNPQVHFPRFKTGLPASLVGVDAVREWMQRNSLTDADAAWLISMPVVEVQQWLSSPDGFLYAEAVRLATAYHSSGSRAHCSIVNIPVRHIPPTSDLLRLYRVLRLEDGTDAIAAMIASAEASKLSRARTAMNHIQQAFSIIVCDDAALAVGAAAAAAAPQGSASPLPALVSYDAWGQHITDAGVCERVVPLDASMVSGTAGAATAGGDTTPCIDAAFLIQTSDVMFKHARSMPATTHTRAFLQAVTIMQLSVGGDSAVQRSHDAWLTMQDELRHSVTAALSLVKDRHRTDQMHITLCVDQLDLLLQLVAAISSVALAQPGDAVRGIVCSALASLIELWEDILMTVQGKYGHAHIASVMDVLRTFVLPPVHARASTALHHDTATRIVETWMHLLHLIQNRCLLFASCTWRAANVVCRGHAPTTMTHATYVLLALRNLTNLFPTPFRFPTVLHS